MSEAVTKPGPEGVLSSIRDLVSEEKSAGHNTPDAGDANKLLLTPQHRVSGAGPLRLTARDAVTPGRNPLLLTETQRADGRGVVTDISDLTEKIAALEKAIAETVDQWEPDGNSADAYAGTLPPSINWPDSVEMDGKGKPLPSDDQAAAAGDTQRVSGSAATVPDAVGDEHVMEEDALRELVADIVRAELQGELGRRITRNIRKMVRRELQRALTAQSFGS